jgi:hypothetical protein
MSCVCATGSLHVGIINPGAKLVPYNFTAGEAVVIPSGVLLLLSSPTPPLLLGEAAAAAAAAAAALFGNEGPRLTAFQ